MATGLVSWSQTAANNANADSTVNWTEGQPPSSVNDSARAMMASAAKWRDDISGAIVTSGTSTAYTVASNQGFGSLSALANQVVAFTPHTTNGATVTLNVDSLGGKPLRSSPGVELPSGMLVQGTPYIAIYNNSDTAFYLQGSFNNPYNIPIGASLDFWGATAPNSSFVLMFGQAISRTTYSVLFGQFSTTYGTGDGSTTFNIPDLRGRFVAGKDDMGGSAASRLTSTYFGTSAATLGAAGGSQNHTLTPGESAILTYSLSPSPNQQVFGSLPSITYNGTGNNLNQIWTGTSSATTTGGSISSNAGGNPHAIIPPALIANKIMRII